MLKLYWVTTYDHDEDWFIVASSLKEAAKLHERMEGYDPGDAKAEYVKHIPKELEAEKGWPTKELLLALGAKYIEEEPTRVVELNGKTYCEGLLEGIILGLRDDIFEELGQGRPNKTDRPDYRKH